MGLAAWLFPIFGSHRFGVHNRLSGQSLAVHPVQTIRHEGCCLESSRRFSRGWPPTPLGTCDLVLSCHAFYLFGTMIPGWSVSFLRGLKPPNQWCIFVQALLAQAFGLAPFIPQAWPCHLYTNGSMQPAMRISIRSKMMATSKAITASTTSLMASCRMPAHRGEAGSMPTTIVGGPSTSRPIQSRTMMRRWWLWLFQFQSCWIQRRNTSFSKCQGSRVATFRWGCFGKVFLLSLSITWWNKFPRSPQV